MNPYITAIKHLGILLTFLFMTTGCTSNPQATAAPTGDETEAISVSTTTYSAKSELFMEYDQPLVGEEVSFLVHLTRLDDFKPVTDGSLILVFTPITGEPSKFTIPAPIRPGIFKTDVVLAAPGKYSLKLISDGKGFEDEIMVPEIHVLNKGEKLTGQNSDNGGAIAYLKEQQWLVDFMVAQPIEKDLNNYINATGELMPISNAEATISAPLSGIISTEKQLPFIGEKVRAGDVVTLIDPPIKLDGGIGQLGAAYAGAKNQVALAKKEYDRAQRLHDAKIAPLKRVEEAELSLSSAQAALAPLEKAITNIAGESDGQLAVRAPISGTVVEVNAGAGKGVEAGQPILRIVDTSTLWLKANIPATEIGIADNSINASFTVTGLAGEFKPSRLVSISDMLDPQTRTLPVLFEVPNQSESLKVGLFANVAIRTGSVAEALTVPRDALIEEESRWFVFTQPSGESFDRREV
ncbi:MAG: efflux RND transporter periplasmic adaptor subunit, partial [Desulfobulbaceae bacterium]|nr:efflux RND transporter periplasmic adaptor subunit [Desulfobulbaceae bacterium]